MTPRRLQFKRPRSSAQSSSFIRRQRSKNITLAVGSVIVLAVLAFAIPRLSALPIISITSIEIHGIDPDLTDSAYSAVEKEIHSSYLGLFSKSNVFLYPQAAVVEAVRSVSPRVQEVKTEITDGHTLTITVNEKVPAAVVCTSLPDFEDDDLSFTSDDKCYFADDNGFVYKEAPEFFGSAYKRYYIPHLAEIASTSAVVGLNAVPRDEFNSLQSLYREIIDGGIGVEAIFVKGSGEYELYAHNPIEGTATSSESSTVVIYINQAGGFPKESANLISFWSNATEEAREKGETVSFDSIDVRYGSNVFYRLNK